MIIVVVADDRNQICTRQSFKHRYYHYIIYVLQSLVARLSIFVATQLQLPTILTCYDNDIKRTCFPGPDHTELCYLHKVHGPNDLERRIKIINLVPLHYNHEQ